MNADNARRLMELGVSSGYHRIGGNVPGKYTSINKFTPYKVRTPGDTSIEDPRAIADAPESMDPGKPDYPTKAQDIPVAAAKQMGYTGDQCDKCNSMRMKMSGHCQVCEDCGETTGCS